MKKTTNCWDVPVPSAALEVKPLYKNSQRKSLSNTCLYYRYTPQPVFLTKHVSFYDSTSKQKLVNKTNSPPLASHSLRHVGPERQSQSPRRHCPGQGHSTCTLLKVKQNPCTKALCIPLAFLRPTTSHVPECVCVSQGECC